MFNKLFNPPAIAPNPLPTIENKLPMAPMPSFTELKRTPRILATILSQPVPMLEKKPFALEAASVKKPPIASDKPKVIVFNKLFNPPAIAPNPLPTIENKLPMAPMPSFTELKRTPRILATILSQPVPMLEKKPFALEAASVKKPPIAFSIAGIFSVNASNQPEIRCPDVIIAWPIT